MKKTLAILCLLGALLASAGCTTREVLLRTLGMNVPVLRDFPPGFEVPVSNETGQPVTGFGGGGGGVHRTPIILVHGNTVAPRFWNEAREYLLTHGYTRDEIWAVGYGFDCTCRFDSDNESVPTLDAFVNSVQNYLTRISGRPVRQVDIVAHSLGVTLVRQWMKQDNAWHRVRNFAGVAGANHGTWVSPPDSRGISRAAPLELYVGSPWLKQLNRGGETPGPTRYLTLYDGTGRYDVFYAPWQKNSPALEGATNVAYDVDHGGGYGHLELPREPATLDTMIRFFQAAREPLPQAEPPRLVREGNVVRADPDDATLRCAQGGDYPDARTPAAPQVELQAGALYTCYAHSDRTGLSSPMARFKREAEDGRPETQALTLTAEPAGGVFEQPQFIALKANDPEAFIVYTTSGTTPDSGSPLYGDPIYVAAPVTLTAIAIAPDGRQSQPLRLTYDISVKAIDDTHTLLRQFDPQAPVQKGHD